LRFFASLGRALTHFGRFAQHRGLVWLFMAWLAVAVICSFGLYLAEAGAEGAQVNDLGDALWWGVVTLSTVGYGDVYPVTPEGRLAAGVLMLLGVTLFAGITGTLTSFLIATDSATALAANDPGERLRRLVALHEEGLIDDDEYAAKRAEILSIV